MCLLYCCWRSLSHSHDECFESVLRPAFEREFEVLVSFLVNIEAESAHGIQRKDVVSLLVYELLRTSLDKPRVNDELAVPMMKSLRKVIELQFQNRQPEEMYSCIDWSDEWLDYAAVRTRRSIVSSSACPCRRHRCVLAALVKRRH